LPIGLLAAPETSLARRLYNSYLNEPACETVHGNKLPFEEATRTAFCGRLRNDAAIATRRTGGEGDLRAWAAAAKSGRLAMVNLAELRRVGDGAIPVAIDGVLPTPANIASRQYAAAEKIALVLAVPRNADKATREEMRRLLFALLSEDSLGPDGALVAAGLVPLAAADRVAARSRTLALLERH
jgi:hypothetical protein